jgi:septal ring factor EnvC (AmiA/AmiB activator)
MTNPDIRMAGANANPQPEPIPFRDLKGQASAYDARAERLVLGIRAEVEELRDAVMVRQQVEESVMRVDAASLLAHPNLVGAVPPMLLARLLDDMRAQVGELENALAQRTHELDRLQSEHANLQREHASTNSRTETLQDVIAALHANLQDLRAARDYERESALRAPGSARELPPGDA